MSKRANGEGSLYQRQDGRWTGATYVLLPDGGRRRRQVYGQTRKAVSTQLVELNANTHRGIPSAVDAWTVESYSLHWLTEIAAANLRPSTRANYAWVMRKYILPNTGSIRLRSLRPEHVRKLHKTVSIASSSASTFPRPPTNRSGERPEPSERRVDGSRSRLLHLNRNGDRAEQSTKDFRHCDKEGRCPTYPVS